MAAIPQPVSHTAEAIYKAYQEDNNAFESIGIPAGSIGAECERAVWYSFRYASKPEDINGRKIRIFRRGDIEEDRIIEDLERIGAEVTERQTKVRAVGGHVRGKIDGQVLGIPEAPKRMHLLECKSSNDKAFKKLKKEGVEKAKPDHFATMQLYMHERKLERALYCSVNKNDEDYHIERVDYNVEVALRLVSRAERIVCSDDPPAKLHEDPTSKAAFACGWCNHYGVCHDDAFPRVNCRTCLHATADLGGDALWTCSRWNKPLSLEEQKAGCPTHLFLPGLVPGEQVNADAEAETVTYKLKDGSIWVDGAVEGTA